MNKELVKEISLSPGLGSIQVYRVKSYRNDHERHKGVWYPDYCETCRNENPTQLYVVWNERGGPPKRKYTRRWRADLEHRRLARQFTDGVFHVLKVKSTARADSTGEIVVVDYRGRWQLRDAQTIDGL